jgi:hypothetical protein
VKLRLLASALALATLGVARFAFEGHLFVRALGRTILRMLVDPLLALRGRKGGDTLDALQRLRDAYGYRNFRHHQGRRHFGQLLEEENRVNLVKLRDVQLPRVLHTEDLPRLLRFDRRTPIDDEKDILPVPLFPSLPLRLAGLVVLSVFDPHRGGATLGNNGSAVHLCPPGL